MDVTRNDKGHPLPGQSLRGTSKGANARKLSRRLRAEMKRRYGDDKAHYLWLMDIAANTQEKAGERVKAIVALADRIDGKPVQTLDLQHSGEVGRKSPLEGLTAEQLLEFIRAGR